MNRSDVRNIKRLAERLGTRDSDVIRFAIKLMLAKLALLQDPSIRGGSLVPVFIESGAELMRHFELDTAKLSSIINDGVEPGRSVDPDDIQLIAMNALQRSYVKLRVAGLRRAKVANGTNAANGVTHTEDAHEDAFDHSLRQYLYDKYLDTAVPVPEKRASNSGGEA